MEKFENLGLEELTTDEMMNVDGGEGLPGKPEAYPPGTPYPPADPDDNTPYD